MGVFMLATEMRGSCAEYALNTQIKKINGC